MADERNRSHWNQVYEKKDADKVSWFQPSLRVSLDFIDSIGLPPSASIIDVGGGASTLVDDVLERGFSAVSVLDISSEALAVARRRLGERANAVTWIESDIAAAELPEASFDLWHDRAVFHFLTDANARARYVAVAERALKPGGHIIVATFGVHGPEQCSGLDVVRYDADGLHGEFGAPFDKIEHVEETHSTPWGGEQEFVYCYCRRAS
jgi:ubiquinone/menaquinone biosynthesis C-methylase UbiE